MSVSCSFSWPFTSAVSPFANFSVFSQRLVLPYLHNYSSGSSKGLAKPMGLVEGPGGLGQGGAAATLGEDSHDAEGKYEEYGYNAQLSDRISLDRSIPDYRPKKYVRFYKISRLKSECLSEICPCGMCCICGVAGHHPPNPPPSPNLLHLWGFIVIYGISQAWENQLRMLKSWHVNQALHDTLLADHNQKFIDLIQIILPSLTSFLTAYCFCH